MSSYIQQDMYRAVISILKLVYLIIHTFKDFKSSMKTACTTGRLLLEASHTKIFRILCCRAARQFASIKTDTEGQNNKNNLYIT